VAKKNSQNRPKQKEFQTTPFGLLKSIVVPDALPVEPKKATISTPAEQTDNGLNLFLQAVADVKPIHTQNRKPAGQGLPSRRSKNAATKKETRPAPDAVDPLFLEEISRLKLDSTFEESHPDDGELKPLPGNRLRQVKRGVVSVEYQLDLHGLTREEALNALPAFLGSARRKGQKAVLVITGRGNHSTEEPVLQQAVTSWLRNHGIEQVLEFAPAPREMGGSGAFVVFLRP